MLRHMATYQLSTLVSTVKERAKDSSLSSDLITDFIQETQDNVLNYSRFPFMEVTDTDTLSADESELILDDEVDVIVSLKLVDTTTNQVVVPQYMGYAEFYQRFDPAYSSTAVPSFYTVFGNTVVFNAPTSQAWTVQVAYIKTPTVLTLDEDVPDVPERYKELLIAGALARVEKMRGNFDISALYERRTEELTETMLNRLQLRQVATNHRSRFGRRNLDADGWGR